MNFKKPFILLSQAVIFTTFIAAEIRYIDIDSIKNVPVIEIKKADDIEAIIANYGVRIGYLQRSSSSTMLYVIAESVYFAFPMNGYETLSDYRSGEAAQFKNGSDFSKAKSLVLSTGKEYYYYVENSFSSVDDCKDALKNGFVTINNRSYHIGKQSASTQYYEAKKLGLTKYDDYKEYLEYTSLGFTSKSDFQTATGKGFKTGEDYYTALQNGFSNGSEYAEAKKFGINTFSDYTVFKNITSACNRLCDEKKLDKKSAVIYHYIQNLSKGELSLSALSNALKSNFNSQSAELSTALNLWFSDFSDINELNSERDGRYRINAQKRLLDITNFFSTSSLSEFFDASETNSLGSYNSKTEIFKKR